MVAEVPTLDISDYGPDNQNALHHLKAMVAVHLESLLAEGKPIHQEKRAGDRLYL